MTKYHYRLFLISSEDFQVTDSSLDFNSESPETQASYHDWRLDYSCFAGHYANAPLAGILVFEFADSLSRSYLADSHLFVGTGTSTH